MLVKKVTLCRICKSKSFTKFLPLGNIPLPNGFLKPESLGKKEKYYPLNVCMCNSCGLVQLCEIVDPKVMFHNYVYIPSTSQTRMRNFAEIADQAIDFCKLTRDSLVIDIGSNDGSLLTFFKGIGIKTLGIDPAANLAKIAELKGIETINNYISIPLARKIRKLYGPARVVTATNVVAHINNLHELFKAVEILLSDDGVFICEFPYLFDLVSKNQFDTIYHEHLSYFSIKPLLVLLKYIKLHLTNIIRTSIDGGSLRIFLTKKGSTVDPKVNRLLIEEQNIGLQEIKTLKSFAKRVKSLKKDLFVTLTQINNRKKTVAAYGAAAKGNILLNYCRITNKLIDFAVDSTPYKQGLYTPGTRIPIFPESEIIRRRPDYVLILAWNFAEEIINKQKRYRASGGKFIIPVPKITII